MTFIIAFVIIGAIFGYVTAPDPDPIEIGLGMASMATLGLMFALIFSLIFGAIFYGGSSIVDRSVALESLVDGSELHGSFFLGSGTINNEATYTWYEQTKDNSFVQRQADADISTIHFLPADTNQRPYYVVHVRHYGEGPALDTWGFRVTRGDGAIEGYDFYVPRGTITQQLRAGLEITDQEVTQNAESIQA
jgi:hypothetical protein